MAFSLVVSTKAEGALYGSTTPGVNTTGADLIVAAMAGGINSAAIISDNKSNTWTTIVTSGAVDGNGKVRMWYCLAPTVGTGHTFTVGTGASPGINSGIVVMAFSGAAASSALDQYTSNFSTSSATTGTPGSITPTENNELIVFAGPCGGNTTTFSGTSLGVVQETITGTSGVDYSIGIGYYAQSTAAAINPTMTWSSTTSWAAAIASFKGVAATAASIALARAFPRAILNF